MKFTNWSVRTALIASAIASGTNILSAEDCATPRWRLFGHRSAKSAAPNPSCEAPSCTAPACVTTGPVTSAGGPPVTSAGGPKEEQPNPQFAAAAAPPPVMFAAPPAGGEITGEQRSVGIRGFAITMPELRLELPTLHLPSVIRSSRNPEMRVDSARAPMVSGTPAAFGHIANAGVPTFQQQTMSAPASVPSTKSAGPTDSAGGPPVKGAGAGCVPQSAASFDPALGYAPSDDIIEMRRALAVYRMELERLKQALDSAPQDATAEREVPPPPAAPLRRISYPEQRSSAAPIRLRAAPERVVGASYFQDEQYLETPEVEVHPQHQVRRSVRTAPPPSAPVRVPPNVGYSYLPDEELPIEDGLGIWKGEGKSNGIRSADGSGKKTNR